MGLLEIARDFAVANWDNAIMWVIGGILIYLAIKKDMEPTLLLPMGFGANFLHLLGCMFYVLLNVYLNFYILYGINYY